MKRLATILIALCAVLAVSAQQDGASAFRFGYLSYDSVLHSTSDYAIVEANLATLTAQYEAEAQRAQQEFNTKYEQFLDGQRDFPQTILEKRQTELQEIMEKNVAFKEESKRLLETAEQEAMAPLRAALDAAIRQVGAERGYAFIINTDQNACPFISPQQGEDVTQAVLDIINH